MIGVAVGLDAGREPERGGMAVRVLVDVADIEGAAAEGEHEAGKVADIFEVGGIDAADGGIVAEGGDERRDHLVAIDVFGLRPRDGKAGRHGVSSGIRWVRRRGALSICEEQQTRSASAVANSRTLP